MKSYKRTLIILFLMVMAFGVITDVIYEVNSALYQTLHIFQKWAFVLIALLIVINEVRIWNKPEENFNNHVETNEATLGRRKTLSFVGMGISLLGIILFATLNSPLPGSIVTSCGLLIIIPFIYLSEKCTETNYWINIQQKTL
ncbi:hypothetical protein [Dyadobacter sp. CY356]|uniref:hypothetical protein n=1 Tax=Dyadobacter sp. CY356 TaxID=2906442 RepID=UPI001F24C167|nr:hypothetical protein [Dyadobacter sp. CY356]MCF0058051.1 hypothetical protein [Dyadobacter sp. CY356]